MANISTNRTLKCSWKLPKVPYGSFRTLSGSICCAIMVTLLLLALAPSPALANPVIANSYPSDNYVIKEGDIASFSIELLPDLDTDKAVVKWFKDTVPQSSADLKFSFPTGFEDAGAYDITVIVVYNNTITDSHDWNLTVLDVKEKLQLRSWSPDGNVSMNEMDQQTFLVKVYNPSQDLISYRWYVDWEYQLGHNVSTFVLEPGPDGQGEHDVRVVIENPDNSQEHQWTVNVEDSLEVLPIGNVEVPEGGSMEFRVVSPLLVDSSVLWYLDGSTDPMGSGRSFIYRPGFLSAGIHMISMNNSLGLGHEWSVRVQDVNRPPITEHGKVRTAFVGESTSFVGGATDPDDDISTYEWDFDGDGDFDYVSDRREATTYTFKKAGTFFATYKVTDSNGAVATTSYQYVVSDPPSVSAWSLASIVMGVLIAMILVWMVRDRHKESLLQRKEAQRLATNPKGPIESGRTKGVRRPLFEDMEETVEDAEDPEELTMVPYSSKMADRDLEAEGDADDTEIAVDGSAQRGPIAPTSDDLEAVGESFSDREKQEIDDLLASLTAKALGKTDLKSKRASAEVGAEDTATEITTKRPKRPKKRSKKIPSKDEKRTVGRKTGPGPDDKEKAGRSMGADADLKVDDDVDLIMKDLIDKGLAERIHKKR